MIQTIHDILLWIHIPVGFFALVLFWIPIGVKKGSKLHRKIGWYYYICMWIVLFTSGVMSLCNVFLDRQTMALFLGFLTVLTSFPLWYSYEILNQKKVWTDRYWMIRRLFLVGNISFGLFMLILGGFVYQFQGMGMVIFFFGLIGASAVPQIFMSKEKAMKEETRMKMHIQGTIISGIAAYTAFLAFGGSRILMQAMELNQNWMVLPWILPTILGLGYSKYMKRKYV